MCGRSGDFVHGDAVSAQRHEQEPVRRIYVKFERDPWTGVDSNWALPTFLTPLGPS